jgi:hypothetical protein
VQSIATLLFILEFLSCRSIDIRRTISASFTCGNSLQIHRRFTPKPKEAIFRAASFPIT